MRNDHQRGRRMGGWFDAATWPLEAAIVWIATGNRRLSGAAYNFALEWRRKPEGRRPRLGIWLMIPQGLAFEFEAVDGAMYRPELRQGWVAEKLKQDDPHPLDRAISCLCQMMSGKPATGLRGTSSQRTPIPARLWKSAEVVDDRKHGLILRSLSDDMGWEQINVPAAPFRAVKAKRGRHPAGLSDRPRAISYSVKNDERLKRKKTRADAQAGITPAPRKRGGGRPKGSHDRH
jgi:hypothetical protein